MQGLKINGDDNSGFLNESSFNNTILSQYGSWFGAKKKKKKKKKKGWKKKKLKGVKTKWTELNPFNDFLDV